MLRTATGYAGGTQAAPTYHRIGDHSETVRIEYDPTRISYAQLLEVYWQSHDPAAEVFNHQYRNAIFTVDVAQRQSAENSRAAVARRLGEPVRTAIEPATAFTPAEDYHQKYFLRKAPALLAELRASYPNDAGLTDSVTATRINGYLGCAGDLATLRDEIAGFGLSADLRKRLLDYVAQSCKPGDAPVCLLPER